MASTGSQRATCGVVVVFALLASGCVRDAVAQTASAPTSCLRHGWSCGNDVETRGSGGGALLLASAIAPSDAGPPASCPAGTAWLAGGSFTMDTDQDDEVHGVRVAGFCLDVTEVTTDAYAACVRGGRCTIDHLGERTTDGRSLTADPRCNYGVPGRGQHPINCVDWEQSRTYCAAHHARLPTEHEWEWAARGGGQARPYPWGNAEPDAQLCWSGIEQRDGTCPVGTFPAGDTSTGIHDLAGNVWEWTSSNYATSTSTTSGARVIRGGSWGLVLQGYVRAADRVRTPSTVRRSNLGLRCAVSMGSLSTYL